MRTWPLLALLLLAGCTQQAAPGDVAAAGAIDATPLEGVVVDPAVAPVPGAEVIHVASGANTSTDSNGAFRFPSVSPGVHRLHVTAAGFLPAQVDATVPTNGTPRPVRIELAYTIVGEPRSELAQWDGVIQCSIRHPQNALALCALLGVVGDDSQQKYTLDAIPDLVQSEMAWEATQSLGERLKILYTDDLDGSNDNYAEATGTSPLMIRSDHRTLEVKHIPENGLQVRVFGGDFQGTGVGVTAQQTFQVFTSFYYDYTPPDGWRFTDTGALHPPP